MPFAPTHGPVPKPPEPVVVLVGLGHRKAAVLRVERLGEREVLGPALELVPAQDAGRRREHGVGLCAEPDEVERAVAVDHRLDRRLEFGRRGERVGARDAVEQEKELADVATREVPVHLDGLGGVASVERDRVAARDEEVARHRPQRAERTGVLGPTRVLAQAAEVAVVTRERVFVCAGLGEDRAQIAVAVLQVVAARDDLQQAWRRLAVQRARQERERVDAAPDGIAGERLEVDLREVVPAEVVAAEVGVRDFRASLEETDGRHILEGDGLKGYRFEGRLRERGRAEREHC